MRAPVVRASRCAYRATCNAWQPIRTRRPCCATSARGCKAPGAPLAMTPRQFGNPRLAPSIERGPQRAGATIAIALHVAAGAALLSYEPARTALLSAAPVMVSLISPPRTEVPKPPVEVPHKPRPVVKQPPKIEPLPVITAPVEAPSPSPIVVPPPPAPPPPAPAPVVVAAPIVTAPIFSADYLDNPAPYYPVLARRAGEQGRVIL